ncbi:MAG TPA: hypothetical protein VEI03_19090 [Stellaceae bacterium]|nr:hypothetical protein [Stellaceae bacterium]
MIGTGNGTPLQARLPGTERAKPGERMPLSFDPRRLSLFDRETGTRA